MLYYIGIQGVQSGPFTESVIRDKIAAGEFPADTICWTEGWSDWRPLSSVFGVNTPARPPALPPSALGKSPFTQPVAGRSAPPATSGLAIASLILGVSGLLLFITSIPAVICGHIACSNIKQSGGAQSGRGMAIAGLVLGYLVIAVMPVGLMAAMAIPAFQKVRSASQEKMIINNLRQLDAAASQIMLEYGVSQVAYADLVGDGPNHYIRSLTPVAGEDYTQLVIRSTDREISVKTAQGRVITLPRHYISPATSFTPSRTP